MVEARAGYFEATRYTLLALQRLSLERYAEPRPFRNPKSFLSLGIPRSSSGRASFPMSEHLVGLQPNVPTPLHVKRKPCMDLSGLNSRGANHHHLPRGARPAKVNVLRDFPVDLASESLDDSQVRAIRRILTKKLAIVQGPPGTGKTHVSILALRVLLSGMTENDAPIVIASQTNHALDQMLRHISEFEDRFIRLGGRTLDEKIRARTLYEARQNRSFTPAPGGLRASSLGHIRRLQQRMLVILDPLSRSNGTLTPDDFYTLGLITEGQRDSLQRGADEWVQADGFDRPKGAIAVWLCDELVPFVRHGVTEDLAMDFEEPELDYEDVQEMETEAGVTGENGDEPLKGIWKPIAQTYTVRRRHGTTMQAIERALQMDDFWQIPQHFRAPVFLHLERRAKEVIRERFRANAQVLVEAAKELQVGKWESDLTLFTGLKLVGVTTTGLSKYRPLIASLSPKIIIVEEAAESMEGMIAAGCVESLQHLILIG